MPHAPQSFVHLHNHTEYSLLDGASRIKAMVKRAGELEMPALALTDHGVMYGGIHFYKACKEAGIKPILGCEVYVAPRSRTLKEGRADRDPYHLTVLAKDAQGYRNLMKLCTAGQMEGLYYKPRIDRELLSQHNAGLIVLSGCLGGEVATKITNGDLEGARETVATYRDIFGPDRYLLEVQRHGIKEQEPVNEALRGFAKEFDLRLAATNDLHYVHAEEAEAHDVLLCLQTGNNYDDPNRWRFDSKDFYLKTAEEMSAAFPDLPQALAATLEVADQVNLKLELGHSLLPPYELPDGFTADQYLRKLVEEGVGWRYGDRPDKAVIERMDTELEVISQTGYATYFLIVWDFYHFARNHGIATGPGRGSAAGSLVAYALGITNLDPLRHGLIFERFLNKDRVSMPDIDCDFSVEGRERVIRYVAEKYGADRVAQIITFTTMASKAAIRDVGRVLAVPLKETDRLSKLVPVFQGRSKSLEDAIKEVPEFREAYEGSAELKRLIDVARSLEGVSRNVSTHAAGVVIAPEPLVNYVPLQFGPGKESVITQYDMKAVGEIGLLKMDFLGLQNLDIIATCLKLIKEHRGEEVDMESIPLADDPQANKAYELLAATDTHGVFQLESAGMRRMLQDMKPQSFEDVTAAVALFRPGPMENIPAYLARKSGREKIELLHPALEPILRDSYGVMIYQEQVMMAARELAGFTLSEADILRAAMGKKDKVKMAQQHEKFVQGCVKNGITQQLAEALFDMIAKFASYGFNRCLDGSTRIIDAETGEQTTVRDLYRNPRPFLIHSLGDDGTIRTRPVTAIYANGVKPVYELCTRVGHRIRATDTHRFRAFGGWRRLAELRPGDVVAALSAEALATHAAPAGVDSALWGPKRRNGSGDSALWGPKHRNEGVDWDEIVSITPAGETDTYDLTVDTDHNFVAEGIVVHNSHAAAYALVAYQTAYLKANYPLEYMTSLLHHMEGNLDKVATAIVDCKVRGIAVLPPDVNRSREHFSISDGSILFGLAAIKNVGQRACELIVAERDRHGPFEDDQDLYERMSGTQEVNRRVLEALIACGACDTLGERAQLLADLDDRVAVAERNRRDREAGQTSLFGDVIPAVESRRVTVPPMADDVKLKAEKDLLGLYLSDHPLNRIEKELAKLIDTQAVEVTTELQSNEVRIAGLVREVRRVVTRKGQIMAYAQLEDLTGSVDVILFPRTYELYRNLFELDRVLVVQGKVDARGGGNGNRAAAPAAVPEDEELAPAAEVEEQAEQASVVADFAWSWDDPECVPVERRHTLHVLVPEGDEEAADKLHALLSSHPGEDEVFLHFTAMGREVIVQAGDRYHVAAGPALAEEIDRSFGRQVTRLETVRPRVPASGNGGGNGRNGNGRGYRNGNGERG